MKWHRDFYKHWYWYIWREGKYADFWTVPHTLFGVVAYFAAVLQQWDQWSAFAVMIAIAVLWEFAEMWRGVHETWQNRSTDVISSIAGYGIGLAAGRQFSPDAATLIIILTTVWFGLAVWGWAAWRKKTGSTSFL